MRPVDVYREVRATRFPPERAPGLDSVEIVVWLSLLLAAAFLAMSHARDLPFLTVRYAGRVHISTPALAFVVVLPTVVIGAMFTVVYRHLRQRRGAAFVFPVVLPLPRWSVFRRAGDDLLALTDGRGLLCLVNRPTSDESLEDVLGALDPDNELVIDDGTSTDDVLRVELEGDAPAVGQLRRIDRRACVLVLGAAGSVEVLGGVIGRARRRRGKRMQRWTTIAATAVLPPARSISRGE